MSVGEVRDAILGGQSAPADLASQIGTAATRLETIANDMAKAKDEDGARYQELRTEQKALADQLSELKKAKDAADRDAEYKATVEAAIEWKRYASTIRTPSKAGIIGFGSVADATYQRGAFLGALVGVKSSDYDLQKASKATLVSMGARWSDVPAESKATLGDTNAAGGWIIPNALVADLTKPGVYSHPFRTICTVVSGVTAPSIDLPFRSGAPARAVVAPFGDTKENVNLTYNGYTATMYTIARVHDVSKQFTRQSQGAAEQDVLGELAHAFALGEAYYILQGSGSSEPYGLQTAISNAPATFTSAFSPAATLVGSVASAIATAAGAVAGRNRRPTAALLSATSYWAMLSQGTDEAGFWFAGSRQGGTPEGIDPFTLISPFGIPVYPDASSLAGTDDLIVGDWKALKLYFGESYRVDSSDVAGDRWDKNLIGFRGEEEIGLDARPAVYAGAFQFVADIIP